MLVHINVQYLLVNKSIIRAGGYHYMSDDIFKSFSKVNVSKGYQPPKGKLVYKYLLDAVHDRNMQSKLILINNEADIFGWFLFGDDTKIIELHC